MNELQDDRIEALRDLVALRIPVSEALRAVRTFPWDSDDELVRLTSTATLGILHRFIEGELSGGEVREWADALEVRDDIGLEPAHDETQRRLLFEIASPELSEPLTVAVARRWQSLLLISGRTP
jgi:hypothetical protein